MAARASGSKSRARAPRPRRSAGARSSTPGPACAMTPRCGGRARTCSTGFRLRRGRSAPLGRLGGRCRDPGRRDRLHYIDLEGRWLNVRGPSITARTAPGASRSSRRWPTPASPTGSPLAPLTSWTSPSRTSTTSTGSSGRSGPRRRSPAAPARRCSSSPTWSSSSTAIRARPPGERHGWTSLTARSTARTRPFWPAPPADLADQRRSQDGHARAILVVALRVRYLRWRAVAQRAGIEPTQAEVVGPLRTSVYGAANRRRGQASRGQWWISDDRLLQERANLGFRRVV